MTEQWLGTSGEEVGLVLVSAVAILLWAIVVIRANGLRSLSKMSSVDFVVTVAMGSLIASVAATSASLVHGALAMATLIGAQAAIAHLRRRGSLGRLVDNQPLLLMLGSDLLDDNLAAARVSESDVIAKLREANVTDLGQVLAVVLESTGDVSVLHGDGPLDPRMLEQVRGWPVARR